MADEFDEALINVLRDVARNLAHCVAILDTQNAWLTETRDIIYTQIAALETYEERENQ